MPLWLDSRSLVLASKSNVGGKTLAAAGLRFEIRPAEIDERAVETQAGATHAAAAARLLARTKALTVAAQCPGQLVVGADQTLALGNNRFCKPVDRAATREQIRALRGRTHELHSALAVAREGAMLFDCVDTARLTMRQMSDRFIEDYLTMAGDSALHSVGGYQLERVGVHLFERIEGDYFTILGLPLLPLLAFLRKNGFIDG